MARTGITGTSGGGSTLDALAGVTTTAHGRGLLDDADAAASRSSIGVDNATWVEFLSSVSSVTWTNMPAAATEWLGAANARKKVHLTRKTTFQIMARVAGTAAFAGARVYLRYSTDNGSSWNDLENGGHSSGGAAVDGTTQTVHVGTAVTIAAAAIAASQPVLIAPWGVGGDGIVDPTFIQVGGWFT